MSETQLANDPAARSETGEIIDQAKVPLVEAPKTDTKTTETVKATPDSTDTTKVEPKTESTEKKAEPSLLNTEDKKPAPDDKKPTDLGDYKPFTVPEGYELNPEIATEASGIFKELGLNQDQAQKLVDFYGKQVQTRDSSATTAAETAWADTNAEWQKQTLADPELGPHIGKVKETISRALDSLGDAKLTKDFKSVMDMTGAGNHPAFVKAFYKMAQAVTEGRHVKGTGPTVDSQRAPGQGKPSAAQALYPSLTSAGG